MSIKEQELCNHCGKSLREQMKGCGEITCYRQFINKQETIEEAAERLSKNAYKKHSVKDDKLSLDEQIQRSGGFIVGFKEGMIEGANYQKEKMFSAEEVEYIAKEAYSIGRIGELIGDFNKWFRQFEKPKP